MKYPTILLLCLTLTGCATKGGWPCWSWQKNTDQKVERAAKIYMITNSAPPMPPGAKANPIEQTAVVQPPAGGTGWHYIYTLAWIYPTNAPQAGWWLQSSSDCIHWANWMPIDDHITMFVVTNDSPQMFYRTHYQ